MRTLALLPVALIALPAVAQTGATTPKQDAPYATASVVNHPVTIGWPEGKAPRAPAGYRVTKFAGGLDYPRQALLLDNGDVLVSEARTKPKLDAEPEVQRGQALSKTTGYSANRITLLRDADGDGVAETRFVLIDGLSQPFGMALIGDRLFIGETDGVISVPFKPGQTSVTGSRRKLIDLPAGGYNNHWTRNLKASADGRTLYVAVGSASNVGEFGMAEEVRRANILAVDPQTGAERVHASGLRNPVGMDFEPTTATLWTAVNERDQLGDDISPDYIVGVKPGGFYGWPYSYWGKQDPRLPNEKRELLGATLMPDMGVGPHAAALGLAFSPAQNGAATAYVARHGSWNRSSFLGYDVQAIPFSNGRPSGAARPFLTGFVADEGKKTVYGRPVSVQTRTRDGAVFVVDDAGDTVWLVTPTR
ncbi:PQQ-dependent sugar dehydrogenase [Sphingomonas sp. RS2018]